MCQGSVCFLVGAAAYCAGEKLRSKSATVNETRDKLYAVGAVAYRWARIGD